MDLPSKILLSIKVMFEIIAIKVFSVFLDSSI
jgi:hypothetical protein